MKLVLRTYYPDGSLNMYNPDAFTKKSLNEFLARHSNSIEWVKCYSSVSMSIDIKFKDEPDACFNGQVWKIRRL